MQANTYIYKIKKQNLKKPHKYFCKVNVPSGIASLAPRGSPSTSGSVTMPLPLASLLAASPSWQAYNIEPLNQEALWNNSPKHLAWQSKSEVAASLWLPTAELRGKGSPEGQAWNWDRMKEQTFPAQPCKAPLFRKFPPQMKKEQTWAQGKRRRGWQA